MNDADEDADTAEIEEEDWLGYMKRSTATAIEQMRNAKIPCWIELHRKMTWRMAMRITPMAQERSARKAAEWNPGLDAKKQNLQSCGKTKKYGGMKSTTSSYLMKRMRQEAMK